MTSGTATKLALAGLRSVADAGQVGNVISSLPGVFAVRVNLGTRVAIVRHEGTVTVAQLIAAVEEAGYRARRAVPGEGSADYSSSPWGALRPAGRTSAEVMALNRALAVLGLAVIGGQVLAEMSFTWLAYKGFGAFILGSVAQAIIGASFYAGAWRGLMRRRLGVDFLVAAATTVAYVYSVCRVFLPNPGDLYFREAAIILTAVTVGRWLELWLRLRAGRTLRDLVDLAPLSARVMRGGREVDMLACDLLSGDLAVVRPGERFPADGVVVEGRSASDESMLTGEALPMPKNPGSPVLGGTINGNGRLVFRVDRVAGQAALSKMVQMVRVAERTRPAMARRAERLASLVGPGAMLVAAAAFVGTYAASDRAELGSALLRAVAVLAVACPWALVLSVPTAMSAALGRAARLGILIRSGPVLEACTRLGAVAFDRTGTLTMGSPELVSVTAAAGSTEAEVQTLAASLAYGSEHPLDRAISESTRAQGLELRQASEVVAVPGRGLGGRLGAAEFLMGSRIFMDEQGVYLGSLADPSEELVSEGRKVLFLASEGKALGVLAFDDPLKPGASHALDRIQKMGVATWMISGDSASASRAAAVEAGIPVEMVSSEVKPEDRPMQIRAIRERHGPTAMVGDGTADGPALAEADVGMAVGCGAQVDIESADVVLVGEDLRGVLRALRITRRTMRAMRINFVWALCFNAAAVPLAALGLLSPAYGAVAMVMASLLVAANSYQLSMRPQSLFGRGRGS